MPMTLPHRSSEQRGAGGFTLVEVLVALLVLALALGALHLRMGAYLSDAAYLRDKTTANWVALNQLELLRLATRRGQEPGLEPASGTVDMMGVTWFWYRAPLDDVGRDSDSTLVPVSIGVSNLGPEQARSAPLVSITGVSDAAFSL